MNSFSKFIITLSIIHIISCESQCLETSSPPQEITIDESKTINPISFKDKSYNSINAGNKIFLTENTQEEFGSITSGSFSNSEYCPEDFIIPLQSDFQEAIDKLGTNAYSVFTDAKGLNMEEGKYYLTNTKGVSGETFNKMMLLLKDNSFTFVDDKPYKAVVRCVLKIPKINLVAPFANRDLELNEEISVNIDNNKYINGYLWKIDDSIFKTETIKYKFTTSRDHKLEFWGKYINGSDIYYCQSIYVNNAKISSSQTFDDSKIKVIKTGFKMDYTHQLHFIHSNFPIAPRDNGGYYVAISDTDKNLHVLSYDKSDSLIKDYNTTECAYPHDITATDYGFAIYMIDANNNNHSYISLYNKNFELLNTVQIMNNDKNDNFLQDSNLSKQIIKYNSTGHPVFGMRFMYRPDNGKLVYTRGRIFLIFAHYNYFLDVKGHTGDTVVTFNDYLLDMDFGITWGASHSLIQSATFDDKNHFWTAALSDAYPEGINVEYTSKRDFSSYDYDSVNKKYNRRISSSNSELAGYIKGYHTGPADGKLGGILYFEKYELYCLVYAKTPNYSDDPTKNNTAVIFITTWKFEDNTISNEKTYEIKVFNTGNLMQLRAGKYGEDYIIIIYAETEKEGNNGYGNVAKGTKPKVFVISVSDMSKVVNDKTYDNLLMNTNEDLRTFRDGVLIWGGADSEGNLVIHKIGTPSLSDNNEDDLGTLTKQDIEKIKNGENGGGNDQGGNGQGVNPDNKSNIISGIFVLLAVQMLLALEFIM